MDNDLIRRKDVLDVMHDIPYADPRAFSVPLEKVMNAIANVPGVPEVEHDGSIECTPYDFEVGNNDYMCISSLAFGPYSNDNNAHIANMMVDINRIIEANIKAALACGEAKGYAEAQEEYCPVQIGDVFDLGIDGFGIVIGFDFEGDVQLLCDDNSIHTKYRGNFVSTTKINHVDTLIDMVKTFDELKNRDK